MENHNCLIHISQLAQETKINLKYIAKYIKKLVEKNWIIKETSTYDKRKKLIKLNRIDKSDKWIIKDLVELNGYTIDDLRKSFPLDIEKLVKELNLEAQIKLNEGKREKEQKLQESRFFNEYKPPIHYSEERLAKYKRYRWCLEKRYLEIEVELNNGLTERQKEILRKKHQKVYELRMKWNVEIPEIVNEKYYSASYVNNLVNFIL
ncbi:hypothetical protein LCGC14_2563100 [marine sediment metagenome]|uniref:Uncharacterized protein n=1 Tax=marine sediment metagenome TaxID=412755 RepID=A0A0F9AK39_9ZZZZ